MKARLFPHLFALAVAASMSVSTVGQPVVITEFKAVNNGPLRDAFGASPDWIELHNPTTENVNLGGWFLTDDRESLRMWQLPATNLPPGGFQIVFASGRGSLPEYTWHTTFTLRGGGDYLALVHPDGVTIAQEFAPEYPPQTSRFSFGFPMDDGRVLTEFPTYLEQTPGERNPAQQGGPPVILSEIFYHPPDSGSLPVEFIELKNTGTNLVSLDGATFLAGIEYTFDGVTIDPGQRVLLVSSRADFETLYGPGLPVAGEFTGPLSDNGERLWLMTTDGVTIFDITYDDEWSPITDGHGFSLVLRDETSPASSHRRGTAWRASGQRGGSPGRVDVPAVIPAVVVNEVLSRPELPFEDVIELHNPGTNAADISGWFLTDDFDEPQKFRLPPGVTIPAGGFLALDEHAFNSPNEDPSVIGFGLGDFGEEVFVFSADAEGGLTGWVHGFKFGTSETNVTFGRYVNSVGAEHFVAQREMTFLAPNTGPRVGPAVISEIHYHPPDRADFPNMCDEYVEIRNLLDVPLPLFDPAFPTNTWRLVDSTLDQIHFQLPPGVLLPPGGRILIAGVNPADPPALAEFLASNNVPAGAIVHGPMLLPLDNSAGNIELVRPDAPQSGIVPFIVVDRVRYSDAFPWPTAADGSGASLHRIGETFYGDDPVNWWATTPTPVAATETPLRWIEQPADLTIAAGQETQLLAMAIGSAPLAYQWFRDGEPVPGETTNFLRWPRVRGADAGRYFCRVSNSVSTISSRIATLSVVNTNAPVLTITAPAESPLRVANSAVQIAGTASDDVEVTAVWYRVDGGAAQPATGITNWFAALTLSPGNHTIQIVAVDEAGNFSTTNTAHILVQPDAARFALWIDGHGTVSGLRNGRSLTEGRTHSLTARPTTGHRFSHWSDWSGTRLGTNPALTFIAASNTSVIAHFVPGPFIEIAGAYRGLFQPPAAPGLSNSGSFTASVTVRGTYSGRLNWRGRSESFTGALPEDLRVSREISARGRETIALVLQWQADGGTVTGAMASASVAAELLGRREMDADAVGALEMAGEFRGSFFEVSENNDNPPARGTNTLRVSRSGRVTVRGRLPDGSAFSQTAAGVGNGLVPFHVTANRGTGLAHGWLAYLPSGVGRFAGPIVWTRAGANAGTNTLQLETRR